MDLVDIDKVLDDLELNEDNTTYRTVPAAPESKPIKSPKQPSSNKSLVIPKTYPQPIEPTQENGTTSTGTTVTASSSSANNGTDKTKQKTSIVNVSNVFSSLNEYVNAGTELSEKLQQVEIKPEIAPLAEKNGNDSSNGDSKPLISPSSSSISTASHSSSSVEGGHRTSSTSSNSSDAGGKRRLNSSSSASSTSTSDGEEDDADGHERLTEGLSLSAGDYILDSSENTTLATTNEEQQLSQVAQAKKTGPSEQQDTSAFSYKNSLYSDTLSNDVINLEGISSISSIVAVDLTSAGQVDKAHEGVSIVADEQIKKDDAMLAKPEVVEEDRTEVKKVVGFESTMDDVSDTELESYLQELEEYDIQQNVAPAVLSTTEEVQQVPEDVKEEPVEEKDKKDTMSIGSHNSIDTRSDESIPESNRGENDEDLISQASTLEFNDLAAMTAANGANVVQDVIVDDIPENDVAEFIPDPVDDGSEIKFIDCTETESAVLRDSLPAVDEARAGAESGQVGTEEPIAQQVALLESGRIPLPRPNSLELPSHVDNFTDKQSSPGHTPPSSMSHGIDSDQGLTLSSTSSDDFAPSIAIVPPPPASAACTETSEGLLHQPPVDGDQSATGYRPPITLSNAQAQLGKIPPFWVPDNSTNFCMQCNQKFSLIKRRHHCRACGQLLCSACCCLKAKLEYLGDVDARICISCDIILNQQQQALEEAQYGTQFEIAAGASGLPSSRQPNPNNPMEYCSTVPPFQQASTQPQSPISVMVPVGVLKRAGAPRSGRKDKTVIFSDGIRPGCDLTELDENWDAQPKTSPSIPAAGDKRKGRVQTPVCGR